MRITTNMLVQQLIQATRSEGALKPEVGTAITAKVLEVMNGALTLELGEGKQIVARDLSGQSFFPGQTVTFDVLGTDENGALQIRPAANDAESGSELQEPSVLLKKLNMADTQSNRELVRTLAAYRIPLNAENIKAAQEISLQAKGIVRLAEQTGSDVLTDHEAEPLKQLAVRLIEMVRTAGKASAGDQAHTAKNLVEKLASVPAKSSPTVGTAPAKTPMTEGQKSPMTPMSQPELPNIPQEAPLPGAEKALDAEKSGSALKGGYMDPSAAEGAEPQEGEVGAAPPVKTDPLLNKESLRGNELKEVLRHLDFEKIGFVIKNQLPGNLETLDTLDKLILGKKELAVQLKELLGVIGSEESAAPLRDAVQKAIQAVHIKQEMNPFELQTQLKSLNHALTTLSAQASEGGSGNPAVKEALTEVKNSLDFLGRLSESATYLHVPVNLGQGTKPMDLYVQRDRSGRKKVNPQDTRIFISLDTNNLDTVQCLVDIQDKRLNIGFKLADSEIMALFSKYFGPLKEALAQLGYADVNIHSAIYQKPLNLMDITQEPPHELRRIDMRV